MSDVTSESAAKLDESARKLDEGAAKLNEGAAKLHEVAAQLLEGEARVTPARGIATAAHAKLDQARALVQGHPLGALATVAAAVAFVEIELAMGLLAGLGATAFLTTRSGRATRQQIASNGRAALQRARLAIAGRRDSDAARLGGASGAMASVPV